MDSLIVIIAIIAIVVVVGFLLLTRAKGSPIAAASGQIQGQGEQSEIELEPEWNFQQELESLEKMMSAELLAQTPEEIPEIQERISQAQELPPHERVQAYYEIIENYRD